MRFKMSFKGISRITTETDSMRN